ncbi:hypothetical protein [Pseudobacteroides cellulosolvens]|uniref:Uncharacterized protein n=1 Tax=Pseudobacteroides cellulosolvens ATCC 35603 = DSM 2933 TaxID=398512 RepID=A0A0L6JLF5_9FIRM|nr:hypothetical protein [Pseudobacteroides cellulosolvens]KNY26661.1 hypothetical protein Bccel_1926 [Pseudobacteroides cellulosolvens ATCC 35603 = DSM 2933]
MSIIVGTELKSDLEAMYKMTGDILTRMDLENARLVDAEVMREIRLKILDMEAILQKDIFTCDYLISKGKILSSIMCDIH